jgi:hypothetical protein
VILRHVQVKRKFHGLNITRSIQDRVFLGAMGLLFICLTGYVLLQHYSKPWPKDMSMGACALVIIFDEVVLTVFLLAICAFIWGIAAPDWIERFFEKAIGKLILVLAVISLLLVGVMIYVFSVGM